MQSRDLSDAVGAQNGKPCANKPLDVHLVKELLNANGRRFGLVSPLTPSNPHVGRSTLKAIEDFQRIVMKKGPPYGRVLPLRQGGQTLAALQGVAATRPSSATAVGIAVALSHASKYKGQVLGLPPYKGECAAGVQYVFGEAKKPLGFTRTWKQGAQVKGNNVAPGTAIASFKDKKYWKHAAILIKQTSIGLEVWDQWAGQPWHIRTLRFNNQDTADGSNNGNLFFVIAR